MVCLGVESGLRRLTQAYLVSEERGNLGKDPIEGHQIQSVGSTFEWETAMRKSDVYIKIVCIRQRKHQISLSIPRNECMSCVNHIHFSEPTLIFPSLLLLVLFLFSNIHFLLLCFISKI